MEFNFNLHFIPLCLSAMASSSVYALLFMALALAGTFPSCSGLSSRKELRNKVMNEESVIQLGSSIRTNRVDPSRVVALSWQPRVFLYKGFLSDEECDYLISLAQGIEETLMEKGDDSGRIEKKRLLAGSNSLSNRDDDIVSRIEERISAWTLLPIENGKPIQITQYELEDAKQNLDYFGNKSAIVSSEPLMATLVLYLSNATLGGEIFFPKSEAKSKISSDCTKTDSILKPVKGNAILLFTVHLNASPDTSSSHSRCPVLEGEMWCATKFFHFSHIGGSKVFSASDNSECTDEDENCQRWAALGECQKNPVYMVGSPDYYGTCRKSCDAC